MGASNLPPTLAALDARLREQNEARRRVIDGPRRRRGPADPAPMPEEPGICRWCRGRLKALKPDAPATYCQAGCAANDIEPYLGCCDECGRDFNTGRRGAVLCFDCEQAQARTIARQSANTSTWQRDDWAERRRAR